ncbi:MAG: FAD-dependent oxidoreductase [Candidatus Omnitrophica bacterium]|nr:FAD-dependent oxidoreductase [Candidatus Omnitrophota bacterium]
MFDVIVMGAGPAGCMCAIKAAERGKKVLLLEKNSEIGKKLLLTGNKRGNITNLESIDTFIIRYHNGQFLRNGFARFFNGDLINFFEGNGLPLKVERGNRVYPASDNASDIVMIINKLLRKTGVRVF